MSKGDLSVNLGGAFLTFGLIKQIRDFYANGVESLAELSDDMPVDNGKEITTVRESREFMQSVVDEIDRQVTESMKSEVAEKALHLYFTSQPETADLNSEEIQAKATKYSTEAVTEFVKYLEARGGWINGITEIMPPPEEGNA